MHSIFFFFCLLLWFFINLIPILLLFCKLFLKLFRRSCAKEKEFLKTEKTHFDRWSRWWRYNTLAIQVSPFSLLCLVEFIIYLIFSCGSFFFFLFFLWKNVSYIHFLSKIFFYDKMDLRLFYFHVTNGEIM